MKFSSFHRLMWRFNEIMSALRRRWANIFFFAWDESLSLGCIFISTKFHLFRASPLFSLHQSRVLFTYLHKLWTFLAQEAINLLCFLISTISSFLKIYEANSTVFPPGSRVVDRFLLWFSFALLDGDGVFSIGVRQIVRSMKALKFTFVVSQKNIFGRILFRDSQTFY